MNIREVNRFFGYAYFVVGFIKIIFTLIIFLQLFSNLNAIYNNADYSDMSSLQTFSIILGGIQFGLGICSIVMIFVNRVKQPNVILGYVIGLAAVCLEFFMAGILTYFIIIPECYLYMEAGKKITRGSAQQEKYI